MDKICMRELIDKNYPDGLITSNQGFTTLIEPFYSERLGTLVSVIVFKHKWKIPAWMCFERDTIWCFNQIDCIIPTASEMLVDVILFHRAKNIDIYVTNLKDELFFAKYNNIDILIYP